MTNEELEEIRRHFGVVVEKLESTIGVVAEGHGVLRAGIEELKTELSEFRSESVREFSELRAMLKLSYAELDTRVTRLEAALAEIARKVNRLEKSNPT